MATVAQNGIKFEIDGTPTIWETVSDIGESATEGQAGIDPVSGGKVNAGGDSTIDSLTLTALYDDRLHHSLVKALLRPAPNPLRDGSKRATIEYTSDSRFILSGVKVTGFKIPGRNGLSNDFARISLTVTYKAMTSAN